MQFRIERIIAVPVALVTLLCSCRMQKHPVVVSRVSLSATREPISTKVTLPINRRHDALRIEVANDEQFTLLKTTAPQVTVTLLNRGDRAVRTGIIVNNARSATILLPSSSIVAYNGPIATLIEQGRFYGPFWTEEDSQVEMTIMFTNLSSLQSTVEILIQTAPLNNAL